MEKSIINALQKKQIKLITTQQELSTVCNEASNYNYIAVDTEFVRVKTYYPNLGLIQIYFGTDVYLIDYVVINDFEALKEIFLNPNIIKIIHACSEDIAVLKSTLDCIPINVIDSQVMAAFLGFGYSVGMNTLTTQLFNIELDKHLSRTDWLARPVPEEYLYYAASDVYYLLLIYQQFINLLKDTLWLQAIKEETNKIIDKYKMPLNFESAYLDFKKTQTLTSTKQLSMLKILTAWRLKEAIKRNLPVNFVLKEENLFKLIKYNPQTTQDLINLGLLTNEIRIHGTTILNLIKKISRNTKIEYENLALNVEKTQNYKQKLEKLRFAITHILPNKLATELFNNKKLLNNFIAFETGLSKKTPEFLTGWRKPYGEMLLAELKNIKTQ